jgi:sialic acid synthase SpsE
MKERLNLNVGYSDHTTGISVAIGAAALGARVIEKHFTIDKSLPGPDHKASLSPIELREMVCAIRLTQEALGSRVKRLTDSEKENRTLVRKSIVAKIPIRKGETFTNDNLTAKRPATGISPMKWDLLIGKTSTKDYETDDFIEL